MDRVETESNHSYNSDSLPSNASSLSGLSLYGDEFAELRHLVNPAKYPQPYLKRSSTPTPESCQLDIVPQLQRDLQQALELNEHYKLDLHNLERQIELKYCNKIDQLLQSNSRLEGELHCANNQITRLIKGYKESNEVILKAEKLDLENQLHHVSNEVNKLQADTAKLQEEKGQLELEAKSLKIKLSELVTEKQINLITIQNLKQKVAEQHIDVQNLHKQTSVLDDRLNLLDVRLVESDKAKQWYKEQLSQCQCDKVKLNDELTKCRSQINRLGDTISDLKIELSKQEHEADRVRLQALKEKEELLLKLETLNLNSITKSQVINVQQVNGFHHFEEELKDLRAETGKLKAVLNSKNEAVERLSQENSSVIAKCIILQNTLKQREMDVEGYEQRQKELFGKIEYLKESEKEKLCESLQLKSKLSELQLELKNRNLEKQNVEHSVQLIRGQFVKFKENYEKVKAELELKNKEILKLENAKQDLFMKNNWSLCELEKAKHQDVIIQGLKQENIRVISDIEALNLKLRTIESSHSKCQEIIEGHLRTISNLSHGSEQAKLVISENQNELRLFTESIKDSNEKLAELEEAFEKVTSDLSSSNLALKVALKTIEQLQEEHKTQLDSLLNEKNLVETSLTALQAKYDSDVKSKDKLIADLKIKLSRVQDDWQQYLKRMTVDQKAQLLSLNGYKKNGESATNGLVFNKLDQFVTNFFDRLNVEDFESSVDIRLKYLDERIKAVKGKSEKLEQLLRAGQNSEEKMKELEMMLRVKDREMQERQKKMDRNNRTLLRKVKEHMRGRNAAEKQLKYLQDLYNDLADSLNTLKLKETAKDHEIQTLEGLCCDYKKEIEKLRSAVGALQVEAAKRGDCESCVDLRQVQGKLQYFETRCNDFRTKNLKLEKNEKEIGKKCNQLEANNMSYVKQIAELTSENSGIKVALDNYQEKSISLEELVKNLKNQLVEKGDFYNASVAETQKLQQDLADASGKIEFLSKELKVSSSNLQRSVEFSQELETKITKLQKLNAEQEQGLSSLQATIAALQKDKYFFQRLSNDLKLALNSYLDYNKKLQEQLQSMQHHSSSKSILTTIEGPLENYDERYIKGLLMESRDSSNRKPVAAEIQGCLDKLRDEISCLQSQISQKNAKL